jgi:SacI homology domain
MSIRVLISDYPHRSIALVTPSQALIFRLNPSNDTIHNGSFTSLHSTPVRNSVDGAAESRCMVEFVQLSSADLSDYRTLSPLPVHGTLGLITINNDVFLSVVTQCNKVATVRPGETVQRIQGVEFYCLNSSDYDHILSDNLDPYAQEGQDFGQGYTRREPLLEHPSAELKKLLSNGSFYYSTDFDLTNRLQDR